MNKKKKHELLRTHREEVKTLFLMHHRTVGKLKDGKQGTHI